MAKPAEARSRIPAKSTVAADIRLSVVIPTHNRKAVLRMTLDSLARQTLDPSHFEVIVIDDGSSDGTGEVVQSFEAPFSLRYHRSENSGLAASRNRGLGLASHEIVVFLDDDVVPGRDFLRQHREVHLSEREVAVLGSLPFHPDIARDSFLWYLDRTTFFDLFKDPDKYPEGAPPMPPMNGNSSVRRSHLTRHGAYDEAFRAYGGEDLDLGYRLQRGGLRFVYNPEAVGYHYHTKGFDAFCRDQERAGYAVARLAERYPEIRKAKRVDLVGDPVARLRGRKRLLRIGLAILFRVPLPVWFARTAIRTLGRIYPLRFVLVPLFRLGSHYYYAKGIRSYTRQSGTVPGTGPDVPLVRPTGPDGSKPLTAARD